MEKVYCKPMKEEVIVLTCEVCWMGCDEQDANIDKSLKAKERKA
jgi:hypothetical protein